MKKSLFVLQFDLTVTAIFDRELECNLKRDWSTPSPKKNPKKGQKSVKKFCPNNCPKSHRRNPSECPQMKYKPPFMSDFEGGFLTLLAFLGPFWLYLDSFDPIVQIFAFNSPCSRSDDGFNSTFIISIYIQCEWKTFFPQISGSERPQEVVWWHSLYKSSGRGYYCRAVGRSEIPGDK